jgi:hypothetical protein
VRLRGEPLPYDSLDDCPAEEAPATTRLGRHAFA